MFTNNFIDRLVMSGTHAISLLLRIFENCFLGSRLTRNLSVDNFEHNNTLTHFLNFLL